MRLLNHYLKLFMKFIGADSPLCYIEEIDTEKRIIIIHSRGISAPIKFKFDEIIRDVAIISNLSPEQASWVGYYYGIYYVDILNKKNSLTTYPSNFEFSFSDTKHRYKLLFQNRNGHITFLDSLTGKTQTCSLTHILSKKYLINGFDSMEACYLGIISGIFIMKHEKRSSKLITMKVPLQAVK